MRYSQFPFTQETFPYFIENPIKAAQEVLRTEEIDEEFIDLVHRMVSGSCGEID